MLIRFIIFSLFLFCVKGECPNGSIEYSSNCYIFNSTESGFSKAELSCIQIGGHLASIHDAFVNNLLGQEAPTKFQGSTEIDFWIGAEKLKPNSNWTWTDGTPFDWNDWNKDEPQNISGSNCAALSISDGYWSAQDCFKSKPFVCEVPKNIVPTYPPFVNCSFGWIYFEPTHSCYGKPFGNYSRNWQDADNYCQSLLAHLPSIHSFEEQQFVASISDIPWVVFWIGGYSVDSATTFKWSDDSRMDYISWRGNFPQKINGESCMVLDYHTDYGWYENWPCSQSRYTICKKPA